jgi:hypothetical protein
LCECYLTVASQFTVVPIVSGGTPPLPLFCEPGFVQVDLYFVIIVSAQLCLEIFIALHVLVYFFNELSYSFFLKVSGK